MIKKINIMGLMVGATFTGAIAFASWTGSMLITLISNQSVVMNDVAHIKENQHKQSIEIEKNAKSINLTDIEVARIKIKIGL